MSEIQAEMVSTVAAVVAVEGQRLAVGDVVVMLESMKMEIPVVAEQAGTLREVRVAAGQVLHDGDVIAVVDED